MASFFKLAAFTHGEKAFRVMEIFCFHAGKTRPSMQLRIGNVCWLAAPLGRLGLASLVLMSLVLTPPPVMASKVLNDALVTRPFRHHVWQDVLRHSVTTEGEMDFALLRAAPRRLNEYLGQLEAVSPDSDPSYFPTREDRIAYWINAHNALALRLILDRYPNFRTVDPASLERPPCREPGRACYRLGGRVYTLPEIRSRAMAYRRYPNIMFALTDFSRSAPAISPNAYEGRMLKPLLTAAAKTALADPRLVRFGNVNGVRGAVAISPFFRRYERVLFASVVYREGERSRQGEQTAVWDGQAEDGVLPVGARWEDTMKPYAPPEVHAFWEAADSPQVRFLPADRHLREVSR